MEARTGKSIRKFRGKATILELLREQAQSDQSIKSFCASRGISEGTFHHWKHRYNSMSTVETAGFTTLHVGPETGLSAAVGMIKIYQPVNAAYLKELLS